MSAIAKKIADIEKKKEVLNNARIELKQQFVGLDEIIDRVIDKIEVWYVMPDLIHRPVIICLWGMTGVGKTDFVRKLTKLINMNDSFHEIQLTNSGSMYSSTKMADVLDQSNIEMGKEGVLFLDEMQRFRSVNDKGFEDHNYKYQDVWNLLSDGKLSSDVDKNYLLELLFEDTRSEGKKEYFKNQENKKKLKKKNTDVDITNMSKKEFEDFINNAPDVDDEDEYEYDKTEEDSELRNLYVSHEHSYYGLTSFKRSLRLEEPIEEINKWGRAKRRDVILQRLNDQSTYEADDYSKLLIFISGNIDEAFHMASHVEDSNVDADIFHENSKKINMLDIKLALSRRFKPEQIARFGNFHVIYPSLNKKSYQTIIKNEVGKIEDRILKNHKIKIDTKESMLDLIYKNGVFPTQGVRPVFSTVSEIMENSLPEFLLQAMIKGKRKIDLYYEEENVKAKMSGKLEFKTKFIGQLDAIKKDRKRNKDFMTNLAVHESGHAVAYAVEHGYCPSQIKIDVARGGRGADAFVCGHTYCETKEAMLKDIRVLLAGTCAETLVFKDQGTTSGGTSDLLKATELAARMIRTCGMMNKSSYTVMADDQEGYFSNNDIESTNDLIDRVVKKAKANATELLENNKDLFKDVSKELSEKGELSKEEFKEICSKHGLKVKIVDDSFVVTDGFEEKFNKFLES